jgi:putative drug exporter of the RND superfamily
LNIYSLDAPLGRTGAPAANMLAGLITPLTRTLYLSEQDPNAPVLRLEILIDYLPFSPEAIATIEQIQSKTEIVARSLAKHGEPPQIYLSGPTPYIISVRHVAKSDQRRVMILATTIITIIVFALVRRLSLTLFMVLATWLTYGATLTISQFFFVNVMDLGGLDWKVRLILFVIVVAVGQDYNIFLVSRLLDAPESLDRREAVRQAIMRTGSVISSCGLIMAATLGSLWVGGLLLLRQLGFALAVGILIDTFFVRPLLVPSFFLLLGRNRIKAGHSPKPGISHIRR